MKKLKRLAAAADFQNHPDGYLVLNLQDFDGGPFDLQPQVDTDNGVLLLPSNEAPAYRVAITAANPDLLKRLGNALLATARAADGDDPDADA